MPGIEPTDAAARVGPAAVLRPVDNGTAARETVARRTAAARQAILVELRRHGPATLDGLIRALGASRGSILQHLRALEVAGLVDRTPERHGVGRPRHRYDVTADAQGLFPANYDGLAVSLLRAIGSIGGDELLDDVFRARRRQLGDRVRATMAARLGSDAPLGDRVRELAVIQDEQGYLSEPFVAADGTIGLREHNCAILHAAQGSPAACAAELDLFRDVLGADVVRESHILAGDRCCSYRVNASPR
ncbi:MAG: helix-turn-helix transcriptional regulator [Candidatus Limnocylindrales bacterium]